MSGKQKALKKCGLVLLKACLTIVLFLGCSQKVYAAIDPFCWPVPSTTKWGTYPGHTGIDIKCGAGTEVYAAKSGKVVKVWEGCPHNSGNKDKPSCSCNENFGNGVVIKHDDGTWTEYAHMTVNSIVVSKGIRVEKGDYLGLSGNSGNSYGAHLHFGIRKGSGTGYYDFWDCTILNAAPNGGEVTYEDLPTSTLKFANITVSDITETTAFVRADVQNAVASNYSKVGLMWGTTPDLPNKVEFNVLNKLTFVSVAFDGSEGPTLQKGTTYYYRFYILSKSGQYTYSDGIGSFTTAGDDIKPTIADVSVKDVTKDGYTVVCTASDNVGISRVSFPTWTDVNGQDDIVDDWYNNAAVLTPDANGQYCYRVNRAEHNNEGGIYYTHVYVYDHTGNYTIHNTTVVNVDITNPAVSNVSVTDITGDGYTVVCTATDNVGVVRVSFPTWTDYNGQDDLDNEWYYNEAVLSPDANGRYSYRVNIADHNNEGGIYYTHIYAYDAAGNYTINGETRAEVYPLSSIKLSKSSVELTAGSTQKLTVRYTPENTTVVKDVTWSSSNSNVAKVNSSGKVTAVSEGTATITAKVAGKSAKCTVTVTKGAENKVKAFVERMYTVALNRTADAQGVAYWTEQLVTRQKDGASIAEGFLLSPEFINNNYGNQQYVNILYKTFFDRTVTTTESAYWVNELNNGVSRKKVLAGFVNSAEFDEICTNYGITRGTMVVEDDTVYEGVYGFVARIYTCALERTPDAEGINYWAKRIESKESTPIEVAKMFFLSPEYIEKNVSNSKYVETLYLTFMDRSSETAGKTYWVNELDKGMNRETVMEGFAASAEFQEIMVRYGL